MRYYIEAPGYDGRNTLIYVDQIAALQGNEECTKVALSGSEQTVTLAISYAATIELICAPKRGGFRRA